MRKIQLLILAIWGIHKAIAQNSEILLARPEIQERSQVVKIELASRTEQSLEEAPSVVSVITREEILRYGFRDLADILNRIPGFDFGIEVYGIASTAIRGIWLNEGKQLVMVNGMMVNDLGYGNYIYFTTIPAQMIERVEILRGPGSSLYGGFAELCVINVITSHAEIHSGVRLGVNGGFQGNEITGGGGFSAAFTKGNLKADFAAGVYSRALSNKLYEDNYGNQVQMSDSSFGKVFHYITTNLRYKNLTFKYNFNSNRYGGTNGLTSIIPPTNGKYIEFPEFYNHCISANYQLNLQDEFIITPHAELIHGNNSVQQPIGLNVPFANLITRNNRFKSGLDFEWKPSNIYHTLIGGVGMINDAVWAVDNLGNPILYGKGGLTDTVSFRSVLSYYAFLEAGFKFKQVNLNLGSRYEVTPFGNALAPRIGLTWVHKKLNFKWLFGRSFRIPTALQAFIQIYKKSSFNPEIANSYEMEAGYKLTPNWSIRGNVFFHDIDKPIVYVGLDNSYQNFGRIQSYGIESEITATFKKLGGYVNVSINRAGEATSPDFLIPNDKNQFLAMAPLKINGGAYWKFWKVEIAPSFSYWAARHYMSREAVQGLTPTKYETNIEKPIFMPNITIRFLNLSIFDFSFTAMNFLNSNYRLLQPYYGGLAPIPVLDRNLLVQIQAKF
ncbi:MAG: TonB-dependent receptor plug domain-containing protein [Bacteroidia bacterium]|nr:TonB-dependent receptor plug domain-containing protein [Bacteroidia bacterium]